MFNEFFQKNFLEDTANTENLEEESGRKIMLGFVMVLSLYLFRDWMSRTDNPRGAGLDIIAMWKKTIEKQIGDMAKETGQQIREIPYMADVLKKRVAKQEGIYKKMLDKQEEVLKTFIDEQFPDAEEKEVKKS